MDALDTLYIMEMYEDFDAATDWVEKNLDFNVVRKWWSNSIGKILHAHEYSEYLYSETN